MANQEPHDFDGITENREQRPPVYFTVLFYGLIVWAVAFSAFYLLSGWSSDAEFQAKMQAHETRHQPAAEAPASKAEPAEPPTPSPGPGAAAAPAAAPAVAAAAPVAAARPDAKALFAEKCAMCHGADTRGGFGPDLAAASYEHGKTREAVTVSIAQGRGDGRMPGFEGQLSSTEIAALTDYLLALK